MFINVSEEESRAKIFEMTQIISSTTDHCHYVCLTQTVDYDVYEVAYD